MLSLAKRKPKSVQQLELLSQGKPMNRSKRKMTP